jgi:hypothetical protein
MKSADSTSVSEEDNGGGIVVGPTWFWELRKNMIEGNMKRKII